VVLVASRTGRPIPEIAATHFAVDDAFRLGALAQAARAVAVTDYFDRLALDRAVDGIAAAHRRLTAEVAARGGAGAPAVAAWSTARGADVTRIRAGVEAIVASGLTLSKLTVAASLLGDLARG
jgi:glutamate dehydrogenase